MFRLKGLQTASRQVINHKFSIPQGIPQPLHMRRVLSSTRTTYASKQSSTSNTTTSGMRGPVSWASLILFGAGGAAVLVYYNYQKEQMRTRTQGPVESVGKALLGGPFELVDTAGKPVTDKDFRGQYQLIYFGFSYCPDICPNEMVKMGRVIDTLDKDTSLPQITPIFITVDPYRDTVAQTREYLRDFHPRMKGLTGTPQQIARVTRAFRVYFSEVDHRDPDDDDYVVDHSIVMYLMSPKGEFLDFYPQLMEAPEISEKIAVKIREDSGIKQKKSGFRLF